MQGLQAACVFQVPVSCAVQMLTKIGGELRGTKLKGTEEQQID